MTGEHHEVTSHFRCVKNASIHDALVDLLGKPITEAKRALYSDRDVRQSRRRWFGVALHQRTSFHPMTELGGSPSECSSSRRYPVLVKHIGSDGSRDRRSAGERRRSLYLNWWMRQSGLAELLPSLRSETVYVGLSAGSMVMAPTSERTSFDGGAHRWRRNAGLVDFAMFPHLDHEDLPENTMADAEKWAAGMSVPAYAIDDQTAIKWSTVPSTSSPRDTGNFSLLSTERRRGFLRDVWSSSLKTIAPRG